MVYKRKLAFCFYSHFPTGGGDGLGTRLRLAYYKAWDGFADTSRDRHART